MESRKKEILKGEIAELAKAYSGASAEDVLAWALEYFGKREVAFATSLGAEDQVLTDIMNKRGLDIPLFTLDTGRMFQETYNLLEDTISKYKQKIEVLFPDREDVEGMVTDKGVNLFYYSVENRKECCRVRKVLSLKKKLTSLTAWITGLRREQSVTRQRLDKIEWDEQNSIIKINPLADWTEEDVWEYIRKREVPYNILHDKGFPSIGCAPCTRAVKPGQDLRAGRWWWEQPEQRECGLHKG